MLLLCVCVFYVIMVRFLVEAIIKSDLRFSHFVHECSLISHPQPFTFSSLSLFLPFTLILTPSLSFSLIRATVGHCALRHDGHR